MNGRLHIGHAMTIVRADVASRYRKNSGEDILFPFGFHCTGMPIYSSAMKLQHGDETVKDVLISMGIEEKDIDLFKDPNHWVKTFPMMAMKDLKGLNLVTDFSRSFVTTDVNPYYDSFVKWQYTILDKQGRLSYEKRPCIYSLKDKQPCADHDRQIGEGVKPKRYNLFHIGDSFKIIDDEVDIDQSSLYDTPITPTFYKYNLVRVNILGKEGLIPNIWYQSIKHQDLDIELISAEDGVELPAAPTTKTPTVTKMYKIFLPEDHVISRSGDTCIVACVPQWYIKYSNPEWKLKVKQAVCNMTMHDPELRKQMEISVNNMDDWCVSREYGLGTKLPNDDKFLIDSLSDSTIYMAYYTICNLLHKDIYGKEQIVNSDLINNHFWNAVMLGETYSGAIDQGVIKKCREQFKRYYPPVLRVSGKDLIYNHLVMSIYHHIAIFEGHLGRPYCQEYLINGYAKLNGKKMSKSTGNFITLAEATETCRTDALRVILMESGDGLEDANIKIKDHKSVCKALDSYYKVTKEIPHIDDFIDSIINTGHHVYYSMIMNCYHNAINALSVGRFRDAITYGWRKCEKVITTYSKCDSHIKSIINLGRIIQHIIMSPIIGMVPVYKVPDWIRSYEIDNISEKYDFMQMILSFIRKHKQCKCITIHEKVKDLQDTIYIFNRLHGYDVEISLDHTDIHPNRNPLKIKPVSS
tara:strand:+ start:1237 stop:3318 length:2082 start_codon:yes stop_codon:yes gene_type:complete